ncbi:heparan-sulfate 6-O-sulfotransferase 1 [Brachionus plicatilis]|uniref:Heparan-sulfate 6-O-sulfotransferase n=1 Tax=Brachionus plicatilis TaxID=10195 RepID=A0A3M7Q849_BRAPC|nr:heparan-sulfate 6-O-sulfotransferase 1 [Brachionus plicatilis]
MILFFRLIIILNISIFLCLIASISIDLSRLEKYFYQALYSKNLSLNFDSNNQVLVYFHIPNFADSDFNHVLTSSLALHGEKKYSQYLTEIKILSPFNLDKKLKKFKQGQKFSKNQHEISWLFSSGTFRKTCNVHSNLHQFKCCIFNFYSQLGSKNDFHFLAIIRHPVKRYLSEWEHSDKVTIWKKQIKESPCHSIKLNKCLNTENKSTNLSLDEFMSCEFNLANNRQTRMLTNMQTGCENMSDVLILEQAKDNLEKMHFFALNEFQYLSQKLFEKMFQGVKFFRSLPRQNDITKVSIKGYSSAQKDQLVKKIENLNSLDMELYKFAINLFFKRLNSYEII